MDGLLLARSTDGSVLAPVLALVAQLRQEVVQLRDELAVVRRENLELRQQVGYWKSQHGRALQRIGKLEQECERLRGENRKLQSQLFGQKSEKAASTDRSNHLEGEAETDEDGPRCEPRKRGQQRGRPGPQRRNYDHLPIREDLRELPAAAQGCPHCSLPYTKCGSEDAEQIEIEVAAYRRVIKRQRYQRTCNCPGPQTVTTPPPPKLIPKGLLGESIWVDILVDKYHGHRPTERLLADWELRGLPVAAGTVAGGLQQLEPLFTPVYEALCERNRESAYLQADETRWLVFVDVDGKTGHRWWLWVFLGGDTVVFVLDPSRSHDVPEQHLPSAGNHVLMVDRYSSYKAIAQVKDGTIQLAFCWAHVRRDFVGVGKGWADLKEWALAWLRRIRALYRLNQQRLADDRTADQRQQADAELREAVATMQTQAETELADPDLRQPCRKALLSLQDHWTGLTRFVDDPRIPLDNNASERRIRGPAVGRKNYYGSGSLWSGRLSAMLFSLFATLTHWNINPRLWLRAYLQACAEAGGQAPADSTSFLPWQLSAEQRSAWTTPPPNSS